MDSNTIIEVAEYHNYVVASLKYFSKVSPSFISTRYFGQPSNIVLAARIEETDLRSAFFILTALEAAFRIDYLYRCKKKKKDDLSRAFRLIYRDQSENANLDKDIFEAWKKNSSSPGPRLIGELRGAFHFRHYLAHGRYWQPQLGRKYDFNFVYALADDVFNTFPFFKFD